MITKDKFKLAVGLLAGVFALLSAPAGHATTFNYTVFVNTAGMVGNPSAPFSLDFQLTDGSGTGDGNNTATISSFGFGGGGPLGPGVATSGAGGDIGSVVTLTDSAPFQFPYEFYQAFTPGVTLSFNVAVTGNTDAGATPDGFSFAILDKNLVNIPTTGIGDSLVQINLGATPQVTSGTSTGPEAVSVSVTPTPEPSAAALAVLGLIGGLIGICIRGRKADA
jgi:hypothetical protein